MARDWAGGADARSASAIRTGMAAAASWLSAASFLGLAGTIYLLGYDGLAFGLGWGGGFVLMGVLVAPRLAASGAADVPAFFARRYGGGAPRAFASCVLAGCLALLLAAQIDGAALAAARFGAGFWLALAIFAAAVAAVVASSAWTAPARTLAALYAVLLTAYLAPVTLLSLEVYGNPLPQLAYGEALQDVAALEQGFIAKRLADVRSLKSLTQPFATYDAVNFFGLILCLMTGVAALPYVLTRWTAKSGERETRHGAAWALFFVFLIYVTAPAYAALVKLALYEEAIGRPLKQLPDWVYVWGAIPDPARPGHGFIDICGKAAASAQAVLASCGSGHSGLLRAQDFAILPDVLVLAAPDIARQPFAISILIAAGAFAAALAAAAGLLRAAGGGVETGSQSEPPSAPARIFGWAFAAAVTGLAIALAALRPGDLVSMAAWACSLAAAGLFPALALGLWWRRANAWGCAAGMILGFGLTLYYLAATRYFAVSFYEMWSGLSTASAIAAQKFTMLKAAWMRAAEGPAKDAAWLALDAHAQTIANWWGVRNIAAGLFGLPLGFIAVALVSLATKAPRSIRKP